MKHDSKAVQKHIESQGTTFRIRRGASIGEPDAESDEDYLSSCFIDTGDYNLLEDCKNPQRIIVGRTGAGKSALIFNLKQNQDNVIEIEPENLSLNYISNSDIVKNLENSGVKMDIFYNLLWKHVFAVELIKYKFKLSSQEKTQGWVSEILATFRKKDQSKERALEYLKDWGSKFWHETEYRVKEITQKLETEISEKLGLDVKSFSAHESNSDRAPQEKKIEVIHRAQKIVNEIQVKALSDVLHFLADDVFNDPQEKYYLVIDKLDENWVEDNLRYRLIRALIETIKSFKIIHNVKIVIALRQDLVRSVFEHTRDSGFQEEKYQNLFLNISWDSKSLENLINTRISKLISEQYTSRSIPLKEIFPINVGNIRFLDYLFTRTLYRPRDAIAFVNECLKRSTGAGKVTATTIREAEIEYSAQRIEYLNYEWMAQYPEFLKYLKLLERMPAHFKLSQISKETIEDFCLSCMEITGTPDPVINTANKFINSNATQHAVVVEIVKALYTIGVLGLKPDGFTKQMWSYIDTRPPTDGQIKPNSTVDVHPMMWVRLGTILD